MIKIENLYFSYGKHMVYENLSLEIPKNQVLLITGINGVGKSTLLKLIAGVLLPERGKIHFSPEIGPEPKRKIGFISDSMSIYENLTVKEMIEVHRTLYGIDEFDDSLIKHTKIRMDQKIKDLSIGQRVIFHLNLILSHNPDILLIDEVIHSIDAYLRDLFLKELIRVISERQVTVILVNLNFYDIENIVDRVILIKDGKIEVDEPIEKLKQRVKKVISPIRPENLPVIFLYPLGNMYEYFIYPFREEYMKSLEGEVVDLDLTEIIKAFIGGEYVEKGV